MNKQSTADQENRYHAITDYRNQLLATIPVTERRIELAGISTAVLLGGEGPPVILLHGPGETSLWWMRVVPKLVETHRVIVPDLPGHGESKVNADVLDKERVFNWLSTLIEQTCPSPLALIGHILGGSIAARYAISYREHINQLVLVDSLGLGKFRPSPGFAFGLFRFLMWPTEKNYNRFLPNCMYDVDELRNRMEHWEPFLAYNLECAQDKDRRGALQVLMKQLGVARIPPDDLAKIDIPTALIWGRHDKANKLKIAKAVSKRYGWPLHIIEEARDDPKLERPEAFVDTIYNILPEISENNKSEQ